MADASAVARVHIESSDEAYRPLAREWNPPTLEKRTQDWVAYIKSAEGKPLAAYLVAEVDDEVVGFIAGGRAREDETDAEVEIFVIHVRPRWRGKGVGGKLWDAICPRLRGAQLRSLCVSTFAELRCCSFYEARGGKIALRNSTTFHGGDVTDVAYVWPQGVAS